MTNWLKLIGCSKIPITGPPFNGQYDKTTIGFRKAHKPSIRAGDKLFLYAPGGSKRIFALAEATSDPERNTSYDPEEYGSCQWKLNIRYLINLPVDSGLHINEIDIERDLAKSITQKSHIRLSPEEYELTDEKLRKIAHLGFA